MNIINPIFKIQDDNNIFTIRKKEYENILPLTQEILEPVRDLGFEIVELDLRDSRFSSGELSKTIKQSLVIKIQKANSIIDLSMFVPKLVDDNYIIINRRKKIPLFQLFDIPIVTRGESIKLRTNVATLMVVKQREEPYLFVSFLGKKIPLALLMMGYYGADNLTERFDLDNFMLPKEPVLMEYLIQDLKTFKNESVGYTQDDFILEIGRKRCLLSFHLGILGMKK